MEKERKKTLTITIPEKLLNDVKQKAEKSDVSVSQTVRRLLLNWVNEKQGSLIF